MRATGRARAGVNDRPNVRHWMQQRDRGAQLIARLSWRLGKLDRVTSAIITRDVADCAMGTFSLVTHLMR